MAGLYSKLAATGIRKNGRSYIPYILTSSLMVMVFYIVTYLSANGMLRNMVGGEMMGMVLMMGSVVMAIFSAIFLFYTNSFLIKRRKKEFGLYNILGLGKGQIARILVQETFLVYLISEVVGLGMGILFSKLAEMLAVKMLRGGITYTFSVNFYAVIVSLILFAVIFACILVNSLRHLFFSRPIELLHSENTGERPPRTNIPMAVIGTLLLGFAYFIAVTVRDPVATIPLFWFAVILVIIATYLLFITGSVVLCRILQKKKDYYYKTKNFVSISQMVFRMRKNGAGLASICILSTMVLVTLSSTVSLYSAIPDMVGEQYPNDITLLIRGDERLKSEVLIAKTEEYVTDLGYEPKNQLKKRYVSFGDSHFKYVMGLDYRSPDGEYNIPIDGMIFPIEDADENIGALNLQLSENDIAVFEPNEKRITANPTLKYGSMEFNIITIDTVPESIKEKIYRTNEDFAYIYVRDMNVLAQMYKEQFDVLEAIKAEKIKEYKLEHPDEEYDDYDDDVYIYPSELYTQYGFDISDDINEVNYVWGLLENPWGIFGEDFVEELQLNWSIDTKATLVEEYYGLYGGLLFLGILLGTVFALSAALIMYYKQISEGFEDAARFEILRKVGMTQREIKSAINSQVLRVFFLPLVAAGVHMLFAFPMISKMLNLFDMYNVPLLAFVTLLCYAVFAAMYVLFYKATSRSYLNIVGGGK
ncbi:MAG: ABC transporter permease [Oscillospiraceae bacterium]|nr:ABC transporter permease [Oscillospiraceae bacterium]